jgi:hypothetical protein
MAWQDNPDQTTQCVQVQRWCALLSILCVNPLATFPPYASHAAFAERLAS